MASCQTKLSLSPVKPEECQKKYIESNQKEKLLILDLDNTLCDFGCNHYTWLDPTSPRPFLQEFLKEMHRNYFLVVWSATSYETILYKLNTLRILDNKNFKINYVLDKTSMTSIEHLGLKYDMTKPLSVVWEKYPHYNPTNTIIVDDIPENFHFNQANGLRIKPYEHIMYYRDMELLALGSYLTHLAENYSDFRVADHSLYKTY